MTTAISQTALHPHYFDACREADRLDIQPEDREAFIHKACTALAHRAWRREVEPLLRQKVKVISPYPPEMTIRADGKVESQPPTYPAEVTEVLRLIDELVNASARNHGLALEESAHVRN